MAANEDQSTRGVEDYKEIEKSKESNFLTPADSHSSKDPEMSNVLVSSDLIGQQQVDQGEEESLTDEQQEFLAQCEKEFADRYTEADKEYAQFLRSPYVHPPCLHPWPRFSNRRGGDDRFQHGHQRGREEGNYSSYREREDRGYSHHRGQGESHSHNHGSYRNEHRYQESGSRQRDYNDRRRAQDDSRSRQFRDRR